MNFFIVPVFINTINWTRSEYRLLIIGLGLAFIIPGVLMMTIGFHSVCPELKNGDNEAIKAWKKSCKSLDFNMNVGMPLMFIIMGISIMVIGFVRLYLNDKPTPQIKITDPKYNRTYPKGFSTIGE